MEAGRPRSGSRVFDQAAQGAGVIIRIGLQQDDAAICRQGVHNDGEAGANVMGKGVANGAPDNAVRFSAFCRIGDQYGIVAHSEYDR